MILSYIDVMRSEEVTRNICSRVIELDKLCNVGGPCFATCDVVLPCLSNTHCCVL